MYFDSNYCVCRCFCDILNLIVPIIRKHRKKCHSLLKRHYEYWIVGPNAIDNGQKCNQCLKSVLDRSLLRPIWVRGGFSKTFTCFKRS